MKALDVVTLLLVVRRRRQLGPRRARSRRRPRRRERLRTSLIALVAAAAAIVPATALAAPSTTANPKTVAAVVATKQHTTLLKLVTQAGLADDLSGKGAFTVFAPTNAAFAKVPKATLATLGKDRAALRRVLLYHVVAGRVPAAKIVSLRSAKTLAGPALPIAARGTTVRVAGAKVAAADLRASNGVVHVVDRVLLPPR